MLNLLLILEFLLTLLYPAERLLYIDDFNQLRSVKHLYACNVRVCRLDTGGCFTYSLDPGDVLRETASRPRLECVSFAGQLFIQVDSDDKYVPDFTFLPFITY